MNTKEFSFTSILILSFIAGIITLAGCCLLYHYGIFFQSESIILGEPFSLFFQFVKSLLLDPVSWAVLVFMVYLFHKKEKDIKKVILFALLRYETKKDLISFWIIDGLCVIFSFCSIAVISAFTTVFVFIMTPFLVFYSVLYYLVHKSKYKYD